MASSNSFKDFSLDVNLSKVDAISLMEHMTLRNACTDYRDAGGSRWVPNDIPEASAAVSSEQIPCLNRFDNIVGHMKNSQMICFPLQRANTLIDVIDALSNKLDVAFRTGRLWALPDTIEYQFSGDAHAEWIASEGIVPEHHYEILRKLRSSPGPPLSASTTHAAMEKDHYINSASYDSTYLYPHNAAISIGLIGSLHDNQCIDMSPGEDRIPDMNNRSYKTDEYIGYICAGHTSHSTEAGRVRRVTCSTRVRILTEDTISQLDNIACDITNNTDNNSSDRWTIFCMGIYCEISYAHVIKLCSAHRILSLTEPTKFSLHITESKKLVIISISCGTLIKQASNGYWADNVETYKSSKIRNSIRPRIDTEGADQARACFSAYFGLITYMNENRAPRPLIASVQTPQAVCLPWCPGNAAVSPCYTFDPIVTTPLYAAVLQDAKYNDTNISSYLPGENVQCLFLNTEYTYEDAIMVSRRYVDNGGFSTISLCSYNISRNETILPVGSTMCGIVCKWWKSPCQRGCSHNVNDLSKGRRYAVGYTATGVVHSVTELKNGDINVRVRSHQQLQDGDKLSMGHGQKGIAVIVNYEDMPVAYNPDHGQIIPDIVMGMSSVVTRQTNGLIYEAAKSLSLFRNCESLPYIVKPGERPDIDDEFMVMSGTRGKIYTTLTYDDAGNIKPIATRASLGIVRVFNQTQMSRERHQISHIKVGKNSLRTPDGRARGGGVVYGEMEVQSASSAGLHCCNDEITDRGDKVVVKWCNECQRLGLLCTCTTEYNHISIKCPYDLLVADCVSASVYNGSFQYQVAPEL